MNKKYLSFIDFETTGPDIFNDHPLHFGALIVAIPEFKIIQKYESYIRPPKYSKSTKIAFKIHGIKSETLNNAPPIKKMLFDFFKLFGTNYSFAGWNVCFDISFFRRGCFESNIYDDYLKINYRHLDVQSIAQALFDSDNLPNFDGSMNSLCNHFNLSRDSKHTGLQDAVLAMQIYEKLLKLLKNI